MKRTIPVALVLWALQPFLCFPQQFRVALSPRARILSTPARGDGKSSGPAVVTLDLDTYVEGVLEGEAGILKSPAALEAMAVLARTWALRYRGRHQVQGFDFCSLTHCQVFRLPPNGDHAFPPAITEAVRRTRNEVLEYQGQLADPYFSADCGGVTESGADAWPDKALPYLQSVPDPYCTASPHSSWRRTISLDAAAQVLRDDLGLPIQGPLRDLEVQSRTASGRARTLIAASQNICPVDANAFRYAVGRRLGWGTLKSNLYSVHREGEVLVFTGRGLGHGVGLCQAGAEEMGQLGATYQEILAHYFPGTSATALASTNALDADPVAASEHFELAYPESQQRWVSLTLDQLERAREGLGVHTSALSARVRVETWDTTAAFTGVTGQPWWAGGSSDGQSIFLQPLATLAAKGILASTVRHEVIHLAVHQLRAPDVPRWFEEGMVLYLAGEQPAPDLGAARATSLDDALAHPSSEANMRAAYARALSLVRDFARRRGPDALWQTLAHPPPGDLRWFKTQ